MKTIQIFAKCNDMCEIIIKNNAEHVKSIEGNVPNNVPNKYGDYLDFSFVLNEETGKIEVENWTSEQFLRNFEN